MDDMHRSCYEDGDTIVDITEAAQDGDGEEFVRTVEASLIVEKQTAIVASRLLELRRSFRIVV